MVPKNIFRTLVFLALWLCCFVVKSQDTCVLLFTIPQNAQFVTADHLSNTYLVHGFELEKYDSTGRFVTRYSNNRLGNTEFVDASNPLKIMVWYADFQTVVFLDRNLTELGRLNVAQAGWPAVRSLASAADGNLWVYDEASTQLLKISTAGEKLLESQPLNLEFSQRFSPICIRDDGGQAVFISDPVQGVALFDPFAQLDKVLDIKGLRRFEVENGLLVYLKNDGIHLESQRGLLSKKIPLPKKAALENTVLGVSKKRLYLQTLAGVAVYGF